MSEVEVLKRAMSVIQLEVLLHYHYSPEQWDEAGRRITTSSDNAHESLLKAELLVIVKGKYSIGERGRVFVNGILATPLPEKRWVMP